MEKVIKKIISLLTVMIIISFSLSAADSAWWDGKTITAFKYDNLQNVKERTINTLLSEYIGKPFSDELFADITGKLYGEDWLSWFEAEAIADGDNMDLVIGLTIYENPYIASVKVVGNDKLRERTILDSQNLAQGNYFSINDIASNTKLIEDTYKSKGYKDVVVSGSYTEDSDQNKVYIEFDVNEGKQFKVRNIYFENVEGVTTKELQRLLTTKVKSFFNAGNYQESSLETDKTAILTYYATKGYPDAKIVDVIFEEAGEESEDIENITITFVIDEGSKWTFSDITFSGNTVFSNEDIEKIITIKAGDVYNVESIAAVFESLASLYYDNGYIRAFINPVEERNDNEHTIGYAIEIAEGPQSIVDEIVITGLSKTKPYVFEREINMKVGDVFSRANYIKSQQNLMNTGLLKGVKAQLYPSTTSDGIIVEFIVEEGNQMELQFGATFGGTVDGFPVSGFLQWTDKNLVGTGKNLSISTVLSPTTQSASVGIQDGWVKDKRWSNGISLSAERNVRSSVLQKAPGSDFYDGRDHDEVTYPLGYENAANWYELDLYPDARYLMSYDEYKVSAGYNTGYSFVWNPGTLTISGGLSFGLNRAIYDDGFTPYELLIYKYHQQWQLSNKLSFAITWDGRDLTYNTTKGYILGFNYTYAGGILGGLSNYNKIGFSAAGYQSLYSYVNEEGQNKALVFSASSQVNFMLPQYWDNKSVSGWAWYEPQYGATKYEMLYIDGMNIGRGHDVVDDQAFLWHNQLDLTFPVVYQVVALEGFVSATGVTRYLSNLSSFSNINWYFSAGVGIKMQIPGFPLGLYFVKTSKYIDSTWTWDDGPIGGLKFVLAISTSIY